MSFAAKFASRKSGGDFVASIIRQKALVYVLSCRFDDRKAWYIFEVEPAKRKEFEKRFSAGESFDATDYGTILHSGWGEGPDEALKAELREKYGLYEG